MRSERVIGQELQKALHYDHQPSLLTIRFARRQADASLYADGRLSATARAGFAPMVRRMLGLDQPVEAFELALGAHPVLGATIANQRGLRVPQTTNPFEALTWAITGQQISVSAAVSIRRRMIESSASAHSSGLLCYPDPERVIALGEERLRGAGFSETKARALLALAHGVADKQIALDQWLATEPLPVEAIRDGLLALRGVGAWTVNYSLLRGFGWMDGSLHGDVAVRQGMRQVLGLAETPNEEACRRWLEEFSPWRALVAAHLWAVCKVKA